MKYYKIHFLKRPLITRYSEAPPIDQSFFMEAPSYPDTEKLKEWFYATVGNAKQFNITIEIEQIAETDFNNTTVYNRIALQGQ